MLWYIQFQTPRAQTKHERRKKREKDKEETDEKDCQISKETRDHGSNRRSNEKKGEV